MNVPAIGSLVDITLTAHDLPQPWPDNRPLERLCAITVESLALTFGDPPVLGGPYARFERRCLATYQALTMQCDDIQPPLDVSKKRV